MTTADEIKIKEVNRVVYGLHEIQGTVAFWKQ